MERFIRRHLQIRSFTIVQDDKDIVTLSLRRVLKLLRIAKARSFTFVQDDKDIVTLSLRRVLKLLRKAKIKSFTFVQDDKTVVTLSLRRVLKLLRIAMKKPFTFVHGDKGPRQFFHSTTIKTNKYIWVIIVSEGCSETIIFGGILWI